MLTENRFSEARLRVRFRFSVTAYCKAYRRMVQHFRDSLPSDRRVHGSGQGFEERCADRSAATMSSAIAGWRIFTHFQLVSPRLNDYCSGNNDFRTVWTRALRNGCRLLGTNERLRSNDCCLLSWIGVVGAVSGAWDGGFSDAIGQRTFT